MFGWPKSWPTSLVIKKWRLTFFPFFFVSHAKSCTGRHSSSDCQLYNVKQFQLSWNICGKKKMFCLFQKGMATSNRHKQIEIVPQWLLNKNLILILTLDVWQGRNTMNNYQLFDYFAVKWRQSQLDSRETDDNLVCNLGFEIHSRRIRCSIPKWKSVCHILRILVIKKQNKNKTTLDEGWGRVWFVETLEGDWICKLHKILFARGSAPNRDL